MVVSMGWIGHRASNELLEYRFLTLGAYGATTRRAPRNVPLLVSGVVTSILLLLQYSETLPYIHFLFSNLYGGSNRYLDIYTI